MTEKSITYEFPLNEFIRYSLRIDRIFRFLSVYRDDRSEYGMRNMLSKILELHTLLSRSEMKNELIKELEKKMKRLASMANIRNVDTKILNETIHKLNSALSGLKTINSEAYTRPLPYLVDVIKQREIIAGGQFEFDIPAYKCWLVTDPDRCHRQASALMDDYEPVIQAVVMYLDLLRQSATASRKTASEGFLQIEDSEGCELLIIDIDKQQMLFPEISGGKHRVFIRFLELNNLDTKPLQTSSSVDFSLRCCSI